MHSNLLTTPTEYHISDVMPKAVNVPNLLQRFINRRKKETGGPFTQEMAAAELGIPVKTLHQWIQGRRTPRGLTLDMLKQRTAVAVDEAQAQTKA